MSIKRIGPDDIEVFTLQTNPRREFISSSMGVTGTIALFPRASTIEKEVQRLSAFADATYNDRDLQHLLDDIRRSTGSNINSQMQAYMEMVHSQSVSARKQQELEIVRFEPSFTFSQDTQRKNVIRNVLYPYYRHVYPGAHWAYTNYHTLNFFTASGVPSTSVMLYPNSASDPSTAATSGAYMLSDRFTFEFYINPRYTTDGPFDSFKAGTILHLSSSYAVSIITGSSRDLTNRPDGFRLVLQVSGGPGSIVGADVRPSAVTTTTPLAFISDDNALRLNRWHYVAIRWASFANDHTGSFVVDDQVVGTFVIPSATIAPAPFTSRGNPDILSVGNFYEGPNSGSSMSALFFNQNIAEREGLVQLVNDGVATTNTPVSFSFSHPLNAEVHELKIYDKYRSLEEIAEAALRGSTNTGSLKFYVPPFFTRESPNRKPYGVNGNGWLIGGIMQTPFFSITGSTEDPFNVALSFGVGGHLLNLENFVRDFITGNYPRLLHLSASEIGDTTIAAVSANALLYDEGTSYYTGSIRKRNVTILPNDNGRFIPDFGLLASGAIADFPESGSIHWAYTNDLGGLDFSLVSLSEMISTGALFDGLVFDSGSFFNSLAGATPEDPGVDPGSVLTIFQRTRDNSSNEVVFFDVSNMFYGNRILPGSLVLTDSTVSGTRGKVSITLKDNGHGGLYRADAKTPHAVWCNVGDVFYDEGIIVVKSPEIPFFGSDRFDASFQGEQNIHVLRINALALPGEVNSSSNPTYLPVSASDLAHETDGKFVYITGLNFHDENLNVVMKTRLAQPVIKRNGDRLLFKSKLDF